jgi:hypothetical protein
MNEKRSVQESTAKLLVTSGAVSGVTVVTVGDESSKKRFAVKFRIGSDELAIGSKREPVRMWSSLDTLASWLHNVGVSNVELKM